MNLSGSPVDYVFAFFGGVLVSFTPCIYPLIPISVGYIGVKSGNSKLNGFLLSLTFVTGVAVTYSILGLIASSTGILFGRISTYPLTLIFVGAVIVLSAVLMWLDLFNLSWPGVKINSKKRDYLSVFLLGVSSGLVVSPCLTPVLGSILAYLATKKNIFYAMSLLIAFAYGMGLVLILAGTSSSVLLNLPKLGKWSVYAKRVVSLVFILMGLYFIYKGISGL